MFNKLFNTQEKRFWSLIVLIALIGGLFAVFLLTRPEKAPEEIDTSIAITAEEQEAVAARLESFFRASTEWGLSPESVNGDNIFDIKEVILKNGATAPSHWLARGAVYLKLKEDAYIMPFGPLWYEDSKVSTWYDEYSRDNLMSFVTGDVNITVPDRGSILTLSGDKLTSVSVDATFSVTETRRVQTANDSSWDGTFAVEEKVFTDTAKVIMVYSMDQWKVYDIKGLEFPFLQVTWGNPDSSYEMFQFDFVRTGEIKAKIEEI